MKNRLIISLGFLMLAAVPAGVLRAQEGPEGEETERIEVWEDGPGHSGRMPGGAGAAGGMAHGPKNSGRMTWVERDEERGGGRMTVRVRKIRGGEQGFGVGGPGFVSEEEALAIIGKYDPAFAKKAEGLKTSAPAKSHMLMEMAGRLLAAAKAGEGAGTEKDAVRMLSLEFESKELSVKFDKASDSDKKSVKEALRAVLSELFDLKSKNQELRVKRMEADLGRLKKKLEERKANKSKIVEQRLDQLTGEGYGW